MNSKSLRFVYIVTAVALITGTAAASTLVILPPTVSHSAEASPLTIPPPPPTVPHFAEASPMTIPPTTPTFNHFV